MGEKNLLPMNRKIKKKNQILKYHAPSPEETMKKIRDQLIKNLLIQWDTEEENRKILNVFGKKPPNPDGKRGKKTGKILSVFGEKPPNPDGRQGKKTGKDQARERSKTSLLAY